MSCSSFYIQMISRLPLQGSVWKNDWYVAARRLRKDCMRLAPGYIERMSMAKRNHQLAVGPFLITPSTTVREAKPRALARWWVAARNNQHHPGIVFRAMIHQTHINGGKT